MTSATEHETLTFHRRLAATPLQVWQAWTDPGLRALWAAPNQSVTVEFLSADTRPGGQEVSICRVAGEPDIRCEVGWIAVEAGRRTVNTEVVSTEGAIRSAALVTAEVGEDGDAADLRVTVQLASLSGDMGAGYRAGFDAGLDNLGETAADSGRVMEISRLIAAPAPRVWAAWTDPDALPHWWGPDGFTCRTKEIDLREGGVWRFDMVAPDGTVWPNRHRYTAHVPERRIDYLLDDDGADAMGAKMVRVSFLPEDGGTRVVLHMTFASTADLAMARGFGAEELGLQTLGKLARAVGAA
jgi:uncharacterized protein YndB with AHSA1/START domain